MSRFNIASRIVLCILFFFTGCASEVTRWKDAESANTIPAYEHFLSQYPNGAHASEAKSRLECLRDFQDLKENESVSTYEDFLRKYPNSELSTQAHSRLKELKTEEAKEIKAWETACKENSFKDYLKYYLDYGDARAQELRKRLLSLVAQVDERDHKPAILNAHIPYLISGANAMICCNLRMVYTNGSKMTIEGWMYFPYGDGEYGTIEPFASMCFGPKTVQIAYFFLSSENTSLVFRADGEGLHHVGGEGFVVAIDKDAKIYEF